MAISRYNKRYVKTNDDNFYKDFFDVRDVDFISHYTTPRFLEDNSYSIDELQVEEHIWKLGDRLYKLAAKYYRDPSLWWVICKFNKKSSESQFETGDIVYIPLNLSKALKKMGL